MYAPLEINNKIMWWYIYLIKSKKDGNWYTGYTNNLKDRISKHNAGKIYSTKFRRPFDLIYSETSLNKYDAMAREKYLKSGMGKRYLKNRLKIYFKIISNGEKK